MEEIQPRLRDSILFASARVSSAIALLWTLPLAIIVGFTQVQHILRPSPPDIPDNYSFLHGYSPYCYFVVLGLIASWYRPLIGGAVATASYAAFLVLSVGLSHVGNKLMLLLPLIPGILFILYGLSQRPHPASEVPLSIEQ